MALAGGEGEGERVAVRVMAGLFGRIGAVSLSGVLEAERERWFIWIPVVFGAGIALYFELAEEPALVPALLAFAGALVLRMVWRRGTLPVALTGCLIAASAGFLLAKLRTETVRGPLLTKQLRFVEVRGWLELVEPRLPRGQRLTIRVTSLGELGEDLRPVKVRVRTLKGDPSLRPGQAVKLKAFLGPPPPPAIPGGYDFGRQAWYMGLGGIGFALRTAEIDTGAGEPPLAFRLRALNERVRLAIGTRITAALAGETGAIANALITGERGAISEATNAAFRDSGLFHVLSISGLHMAVMAGAIFWTMRLVLAAIPSIALRFPVKKWAAVGAALGALFYLLISGSSPPTQRSYLMISIMFLAVLLDRPALALRNVALSALILLAIWPENLLDIGFQMSYAAVGALVAAAEYMSGRRGAAEQERRGGAGHGPIRQVIDVLGGISSATIIASFAVAPFGAYYFHKSQQYAILGNVVGLPISDLYVMPLALATLVAMPFGLEAIPLWLMGWGIDAMVSWARFVARLPGAVASLPAMPDLAFRLMLMGGIWIAAWGKRWRLLGLIPVLAGLALAPFAGKPDILVGRDGKAVAVRLEGGGLSAMALRGNSYDLARWLEYDGDDRQVKEVASGKGFRCDAVGCTAQVAGVTLAVALQDAALSEDCRRATVLVIKFPGPRVCATPQLRIDTTRLKLEGAHAIYLSERGMRVATVEAERGNRPWSSRPRPRLAGAVPDKSQSTDDTGDPGRQRSAPLGDDDDESMTGEEEVGDGPQLR